ncbi:MAG: carbohydrate-binding family 9-like protein [Pirellulales bacterium]|nr:carbohydrate-binding family 9-like protein [Pirellulales bacterium]
MSRLLGLLMVLVPTASTIAADTIAARNLPSYEIQRAGMPITVDGRLDEPAWVAAPSFGPFAFPWFKEGTKEQTVAKMLWDDKHVYIAHICQDAHITARHANHDDPIPEDDCFEVMMAPDAARPNRYYNIEWNLLGGYVDGHRPDGASGPRAPWDVRGLRVGETHVGEINNDEGVDSYWICEVAVLLSNFAGDMPRTPPEAGDEWRLNFNRHGGDVNMQYSQWSPADTPAPTFHTPETFGRVIFSARTSPFASGERELTTSAGPAP